MDPHYAKALENLTTTIVVETKTQPLYNLLRYPPCNFEKTDIIHIITDPHNTDTKHYDEFFKKPKLVQVIKKGVLADLTEEDINNIKEGFGTYHYNIKSSAKNSAHMDIGAIAIDKKVYSKDKDKWDLQYEHQMVCQAALTKKIIKNKNSTGIEQKSVEFL
jgi:hypothetical protein